jgi:site-specific recombinase XerD
MSIFERGGRGSGRWVVDVPAPGFGRGRVYKSLPKGVNKKQASDIHAMLLGVIALRAWDVLEAIVEDRYPATQAWLDYKHQDPGLIRESWKAYRRKHAADRIDRDEVLDAWLAGLGSETTQRTKRGYRGQVQRFLAWVRERKGPASAVFPDDFSVENLKRFQVHLMGEYLSDEWQGTDERKAKGATANRYQIALRTFGGYLHRKGLIEENWASTRHLPRMKERMNEGAAMSAEEWQIIREAAIEVEAEQAELHAGPDPFPGLLYWDLLVSTGLLAYKEAARLRPSDIRLTDRRGLDMVPIVVRGTKSENRDRTIYIPMSLAERLAQHAARYHIQPNEPLFSRAKKRGKHRGRRMPWSKRDVLDAWHPVLERAKQRSQLLPDYTPFNLRHTFGRFAVEGDPANGIPGTDLRTLAQLMGHGKNIKTTTRYLHYQSGSQEERGAWVAARNAGLEVAGSDQTPEDAAVDLIVRAAERAGLDPVAYLQAKLRSKP